MRSAADWAWLSLSDPSTRLTRGGLSICSVSDGLYYVRATKAAVQARYP